MNKLLAAMDTPGGHMGICLFLITFGICAHIFLPTDSLIHDTVIGATGVMFGAMKGNNGAKISVIPSPPQADK